MMIKSLNLTQRQQEWNFIRIQGSIDSTVKEKVEPSVICITEFWPAVIHYIPKCKMTPNIRPLLVKPCVHLRSDFMY
jgi:hypothetical protein